MDTVVGEKLLQNFPGGPVVKNPPATHVHPWLIHVKVWQKPPQYYKVISLQLKIFLKKEKKIN